MSESEEEKEQLARNRQIVEDLRENFRAVECRLTPEVEPAVVFFPAVTESAE